MWLKEYSIRKTKKVLLSLMQKIRSILFLYWNLSQLYMKVFWGVTWREIHSNIKGNSFKYETEDEAALG